MVLTLPLGIKQEAQAAKRQRVEPALGADPLGGKGPQPRRSNRLWPRL